LHSQSLQMSSKMLRIAVAAAAVFMPALLAGCGGSQKKDTKAMDTKMMDGNMMGTKAMDTKMMDGNNMSNKNDVNVPSDLLNKTTNAQSIIYANPMMDGITKSTTKPFESIRVKSTYNDVMNTRVTELSNMPSDKVLQIMQERKCCRGEKELLCKAMVIDDAMHVRGSHATEIAGLNVNLSWNDKDSSTKNKNTSAKNIDVWKLPNNSLQVEMAVTDKESVHSMAPTCIDPVDHGGESTGIAISSYFEDIATESKPSNTILGIEGEMTDREQNTMRRS